jgi:hypothetical protein
MLSRSAAARRIGPWGTTARVIGGGAMLVAAPVIGVGAVDALVGLVALPAAVSAFVALRGRDATPIRLTGRGGHCLNCGLIVAAFVVVPVGALLFYGGSMVVAGARGDAGCELFAVSNALWRRDDQIACPVLAPVDAAETRARHRDTSL